MSQRDLEVASSVFLEAQNHCGHLAQSRPFPGAFMRPREEWGKEGGKDGEEAEVEGWRGRDRGEGRDEEGSPGRPRGGTGVCVRLQWEAAQALCPSACPCPGPAAGHGVAWSWTSVAVSRRPTLAEGHSC